MSFTLANLTLTLGAHCYRFQAVEGKLGYHSTGVFYAVICNNPRSIHYLPEETILVMVMPGPDELSLEEMNYLLEPFVESMLRLEKGVEFTVHGHDDPEVSHSHLYCNVSDLPSSRKVTGLQGHSSKFFMCPTCKTPSFSLAHPSCFDPSKFKDQDDWRWSEQDLSSQWTDLSPFFQGSFGQSKQIAYRLQSVCYLFFIVRIIIWFIAFNWQGITKSRPVLFVALYDAWAVDGEIPDHDAPPSASNTKNFTAQATMQKTLHSRLLEHLLARNTHPSDAKTECVNSAKMDRNLRRHYAVILEFSATVRILSSQSISPNDVRRGCVALSHATQSWARMGCHLTPYFHFVNHFERQMYEFRPCYATWAFAFERHNGRLAKINHNQHKGGELEATLMRWWWSITFNYELDDEDSLHLLRTSLKAQEKANVMQDQLTFAKHPKKLNLLAISDDLYQVTYEYLRNEWRAIVHLKCLPALWETARTLWAMSDHTLTCGCRDFAMVLPPLTEGSLPAMHILMDVNLRRSNLAIVWHFISDDNIPEFPWALWAIDLGVAAWYADQLGDLKVIPINALTGHFILAPIEVHDQMLWITVVYDHGNPEADVDIDDD
ncbi:hypothetical protein DFJ58DRAFT_880847 [Suillus subalutaceus]|uniref:uncharacterized protein n=1 Tax=Suillus subalutaceus TaxID=48586 RepID=UPI001B87741A|nr:uncharacterized protein DFJ58DRAFT_880847 [Suillus subalutaceus]KAG1855341.1 hypothetical protein DFJ58DRAFT_880847 [Suillus subalutaceus]